jgi:hypothetical protein
MGFARRLPLLPPHAKPHGQAPQPQKLPPRDLPLAVLIAVAVLAGVAIYWFLRAGSRRMEDQLVNLRCLHCKRRLHFRKSRSGHRGIRPRCRHHIIYPINPETD